MVKPAISPTIKMNNGLDIPSIGLGTWKSEPKKVKEAVKYALLEAGYRHIDCAYVYRNQTEIGEALNEVFETSELKREDVFITSKCWNTFHSRSAVMQNAKQTLSQLGLDYLDLYLIHWPMGFKEGTDELFPKSADGKFLYSDVSYIETWLGMEDVLKAGLTRSIGVSNFNSDQLYNVIKNGSIKPVTNQVERHPYLSQEDLINFCERNNVIVTAYSPFGSPDRPWAKPDDPKLLKEPIILSTAKAHGKTPAQILVRFSVQRGLVTIPKSITPKRISENINVFDFELSPIGMKALASFNRHWRACNLLEHSNSPYYPFTGIKF